MNSKERADNRRGSAEGTARTSLLFDLYGALLTEKKRKVLSLYHEEDMSLSEIAEDSGISRAAVYDSLRSAEDALAGYEEKLGFLAELLRREEAHARARAILEEIRKTHGGDGALMDALEELDEILRAEE